MSAIVAAMMLAIAPGAAEAGVYDCTFDKMVIVYRAAAGWGVNDNGSANNTHEYKNLTLTISPDNRVRVGIPPDSLDLSGDYAMTSLVPGQYRWTSVGPAYCGVIDAQCVATADLHTGKGGGKPALIIHVGAEVGDGAAKSIGTVQFLYTCERQA